MELEEVLKHGIDWLAYSDIRIKDPTSPFYGAYCNFYDLRTRSYPLIYCEITGYALQFWLRLYQWRGEDLFLDMAKDAGEFLLRAQEKDGCLKGAFPYGFILPSGNKIEKYYSFDTGICLAALIDLYQITREDKYLNGAIAAGEWLITMQNQDGSFVAVISREDNGRDGLPIIEGWFGDGSCLHAKNGIGFLKLYKILKSEKFLNLAERTLDWIVALQNPDGSFRANIKENYIFTHAHCYTLEGLLYAYSILGSKSYLDPLIRGGRWLISKQNKDGSLYKYYGQDIKAYLRKAPYRRKFLRRFLRPRDTGPVAQTLRIWLSLYYIIGDKTFWDRASKAIDSLLSMQVLNRRDRNTFGGFFASVEKYGYFNRYSPLLSPWECMFICHAIIILQFRDPVGKEQVWEIF